MMTFRELSGYFQKLESTSSRNVMVEILAGLFKEATAAEIDKIAYLLQGRVAPLYEPIEFGMAEKMVIKALSQAYGIDTERVSKTYKKVGDLGITADTLNRDVSIHRKYLGHSVSEVFEKLYAITQTTGVGSVEKKVRLLSELLKESDPLSAKYIARTPVDKLRLGFSDMTILDGLSWMIDETKKHKPTIEAVYNIRPDLGTLAVSVKRLGVRGLSKIGPKVGTPILAMRAERLTTAGEILDKGHGTMAVEPKLDGLRTQLHFIRGPLASQGDPFIRLYSRGLENVTAMYPDMVAAAKKEISADEVILDGEAIGFDLKTGKFLHFQETVQRKRKYDVEVFSKNVPLRLVTFDCLYLNGKSLINEPYSERRRILEELIKNHSLEKNDSSLNGKIIVAVEMKIVDKPEELEKLFDQALKKGLEGIMAKKVDGVYQAGARGWNWIKLKGSYTGKLNDTVDAVVMGYDFGQGKRSSFGVGAFLVGVYDARTDSFKTISKIGTGLTDEEWRELRVKGQELRVKSKPVNYDVNKVMDCDVWVKPKIVGEFLADEITKSPMHTAGYALRFPRLVQWREKKPEDTTSLKEIEEMVRLQSKL